MTRRRKLLVASLVLALFCLGCVLVFHARPVQQKIWSVAATAISNATGLEVAAEQPEFRIIPGHFSLQNVVLSTKGRTLVAIEEINASWRWRFLFSDPRRIETLVVEGFRVESTDFPSEPGDDTAVDLDAILGAFEIGEFRLHRGSAEQMFQGVEIALREVGLRASLVERLAEAVVEIDEIGLEKAGRNLSIGPLLLRLKVDSDGIVVDRLDIDGKAVALDGRSETSFGSAGGTSAEVKFVADLEAAVGWWDPNLVTGLDPFGLLELEGFVRLDSDGRVAAEFKHLGGPLRVAGYGIEDLGIEIKDGISMVAVAHPSWGRASAAVDQEGVATVSAELDQAPVDQLLAFSAPRFGGVVKGPARLSGELDARLSYPVVVSDLEARADLRLDWADGSALITGEGTGLDWRVSRLDLLLPGGRLRASGTIDSGSVIDAEIDLVADHAGVLVDLAERWNPEIADFGIGGGPIVVRGLVAGDLARPRIDLEAEWSAPEVAGTRLLNLKADISGGLEQLDWVLNLDVALGSTLDANGTAQPVDKTLDGRWSIDATDFAPLTALVALEPEMAVTGTIHGSGEMGYGPSGPNVSGEIVGEELGIEGWLVHRSEVSFQGDSRHISVNRARLEMLGGSIDVVAEAGFVGEDWEMDGEARWRELDVSSTPFETPEIADGRIDGTLRFGGTLSDPEIDLETRWRAASLDPVVGDLNLTAAVRQGVFTVLSSEVNTAAGSVVGEAEIPIGSFERPTWLWPSAAPGTVRASLAGSGLRSGPLVQALGLQFSGIEAETDLRVDFGWVPSAGTDPMLMVEANGFKLIHATGVMAAEGPLVIRLDGERLQIDPVVLQGPLSRIEAEALYDPTIEKIAGRLRAEIEPGITRNLPLPVPVQMDGPIKVSVDFQAPVSVERWRDEARGEIQVDHRGGTISMRDPPLQIADLVLDATFDERGLYINDGRATVNRGTVELAGGWDPDSAQGVVADVNDVTIFTAGILTKWDGEIAIEPHPERLAHVVGDLTLLAGLWDESLALAGAFFGEESIVLPADDPLHEISLDLTVRGRSGIRVDNNLGRFDAAWDVMRIGGSAAAPVIEGEVRIAPGGTISLAGNSMTVRRGSLAFTGNPAVDPIVEIIPETGAMLFGSDSEDGVDPTLLATRGLATGLSSVLGFENETLQPADIAVQIERDPSVQFMVGQRVTRNLALFFGANLTDVQDRTTMIQAWNFQGLRGLVFQAYQETIDSNLGVNVMQRFRWGGVVDVDDRPMIHRLRLEGEWPLSKRSLRKSTRLRRGQPFDPFLLFVAAVRMEGMLAENGYQKARVRVVQTGPEKSPTMVFTVEPGVRQIVDFVGDAPAGAIRREVTALYRPSPLEKTAFGNMEAVVRRQLVTEGYLDAEISVSRNESAVSVNVERGVRSSFKGPLIDGVSRESSFAIHEILGTRSALSLAINDPDRVGRSIERILAADGYLEARVERVWLDETVSGSPTVRISVIAGTRATIDEVVLVGSDPLNVLEMESFGIRRGLPLDRSAIDAATRAVRRKYLNAGYREARVRNTLYEDENGWAVLIDLIPGRQRTINNIIFTGSKGISDRVLRRGLLIEEGEMLTDAGVDGSASRIANFAPVERVEVRTVNRGATQADVELDVFRRKRWKAEVGGGWSTERGVQGRFGLVDGNLFHRGVTLNLRGSFDSVEQRVFLVSSMPPAPGSRVSLISTVGYSIGDAPDEPDLLEQDEILASLEAQYALNRGTSLGVYYRWTKTHTYEKVPDDFFPFDINLKIGVLGVRTIVDRYDNLFDPRSGYSMTSDLGWSSGSIGSDLEYVSWLTNFGLVLSPFKGSSWLQTLRLGVSEPLKGTNLDREAKFFAGGQSSIRGFDLNSVGPVTFGIDGSLVPAGGGALFVLNEELRIPIYGPFRAAIFADIGQVWESWSEADLELSIGVGAGVRWSTPVGPLWADIAWPVENVGISSKKMKFYLGIGRTF